ncbi:o-succinylbenzoate--CoA ligase [Sporolactobacillus sp. THM7-7]|nr:o-succinylbenzoate--CoA ligase [Sporolactobacillus sp. THM7-7]
MPNWLRQRAALTPDRVAYETENETVDFLTLYQQVSAVADRLGSLGIRSGDRVALLGENSLEFIRFFHALMAIGAVAVPLNTRLTAEEEAWQVADSGAGWLITDPACHEKALSVCEKKVCRLLTMQQVRKQPAGRSGLPAEADLNQPCTIIYTSGTTGHPKGVILTLGNHWWNATGSILNLGFRADDKWLCCVPLFHVSGISIVMKNVIYGMPVVLSRKFNPQAANRQIRENGVTMMSVVTNMLRRMLDALGEDGYPERFRCMLLGGGPAPLPLLNCCREKGVPVYQTYGLTETASQMATLAPEFMFDKLGSAGKPLFPGQIRIVSEGQDQGPNVPGEIAVKGLNVTSGYWRRPEATRKAIRDGWLYTGDIGYLDPDGFLYVLDRRKDLIISGGENVYPAEIESVLTGHPCVQEAGVIGIKDEQWGMVPYAFVKTKAGCRFSEAEMLQYCSSHLAKYKVPVHIRKIKELPRNASRKLLRRKLFDFIPDSQVTD